DRARSAPTWHRSHQLQPPLDGEGARRRHACHGRFSWLHPSGRRPCAGPARLQWLAVLVLRYRRRAVAADRPLARAAARRAELERRTLSRDRLGGAVGTQSGRYPHEAVVLMLDFKEIGA